MKNSLVLSLIIIFLTSFAFAGTIDLPKTGQTKCYETTGTEIPCAGTGQDGDIQAGVAWPEPRFTVKGDCVTDNLTGLMWTKNANLTGSTKTWLQALEYVTGMNAGTYPNFSYKDWRLPNVNELESLVNAGEADINTWLNTQGFTNVQGYYWSSTTCSDSISFAWFVTFGGGVGAEGKTLTNYVWSVRTVNNSSPAQIWKTGQTTSYGTGDDGDLEKGVSWPTPRFTDHGGGIVTDNLTGLMWTKDANLSGGTETYQEALEYVKGMNAGTYENFGYTDWRLPNRKELHSLTDFSRYNPALPAGHPFTKTDDGFVWWVWSSTTIAYDTKEVWLIDIWDGMLTYYSSWPHDYVLLWPVRSGQIQPPGCSSLADVKAKYQAYKNGQATLRDVINCYREWKGNRMGR
jgi:hypothetical protein